MNLAVGFSIPFIPPPMNLAVGFSIPHIPPPMNLAVAPLFPISISPMDVAVGLSQSLLPVLCQKQRVSLAGRSFSQSVSVVGKELGRSSPLL